ncbi:MAG: desulfoferrodoxin Dfx [Solobacterium sp.]|nr:desulfoferrodoxin Dfx [Solobacterium sp.]
MKEFKVYRCTKCGKIHVEVNGSACPTMCCGQEMVLLKANTTDGAAEKHVPSVTRDGQKVIVNVGSVDHPMLPEHYIMFVALETASGISLKYLNPGEAPHAEFLTEDDAKAVYEFCNLHGLWKAEL